MWSGCRVGGGDGKGVKRGPTTGEFSTRSVYEPLSISGPTRGCSWREWPGWPPMQRLAWPSGGGGGGGLTRSEEGGFEEGRESFCALAKRASRLATGARRESNCDCRRLQLTQLDFLGIKNAFMHSPVTWLPALAAPG